MKYKLRIVIAILCGLILLLITGCISAGLTSAVSKEKLNTIKRVGIVSLLGDDIELHEHPALFLQNSRSFSVESWKIDEYVQDIIAKEISTNPKFTVVKLAYDRNRLIKLNLKERQHYNMMIDQLSTITKENRLDAIIVIDYIGNPEYQSLPLYLAKGELTKNISWKVASHIYVFDGASLEKIGRSWFLHRYDQELDESYWPPSISNVDKLRFLENMFKRVLKEELIIKIKDLGFIDTKNN
jgi:hypothetical protein